MTDSSDDADPHVSDDLILDDEAEPILASELFTADDFWLDASMGHGAQSSAEDWVREHHAPISHDGRALTRTTFYPRDADTIGPGQAHRPPDKVRTWKDLAGWNDGMFSDISRGGQNFKADKLRWIDTFAGQLECSPHQRDRVEWMLDRIDMAPFQGARIPVENVILGLLSLAIDRDARAFENRAIERDDMQSLMVDLGMERTDLVQIRKLLHKNEREVIKSTGEDRVR